MRIVLLAGLLLCSGLAQAATPVDVASFTRRDGFESRTLSPNGEYYAAVGVLDDRSVLLLLDRADNKPLPRLNLGAGKYVHGFHWVNPTMVLATMSEKIGALDTPLPTGNLYSVDARTGGVDILVGPDVVGMSIGTHIGGHRVRE